MSDIALAAKAVSSLRQKLETSRVNSGADFDKSLKAILSILERIEARQAELESNQTRMSTTFSNAILQLADKVEKISGGEDSSFSLAHSLEKLIGVLTNKKLKIIRDKDGNMSALEPY